MDGRAQASATSPAYRRARFDAALKSVGTTRDLTHMSVNVLVPLCGDSENRPAERPSR